MPVRCELTRTRTPAPKTGKYRHTLFSQRPGYHVPHFPLTCKCFIHYLRHTQRVFLSELDIRQAVENINTTIFMFAYVNHSIIQHRDELTKAKCVRRPETDNFPRKRRNPFCQHKET